jgi:hypothetical protein
MSHFLRFVYVWGRAMNCRRLIEIKIAIDPKQSICKLIRRSILLHVLDKKHCRSRKIEKKIKRTRLWNISGAAFAKWTLQYWLASKSYDASTMIYCYRSKQLAHFWNCTWNGQDWIKQFPNVIRGLISEFDLRLQTARVVSPRLTVGNFRSRSWLILHQRITKLRPQYDRQMYAGFSLYRRHIANCSHRSQNKLARTLARWRPISKLSTKAHFHPRCRRKRFSLITDNSIHFFSTLGLGWRNPYKNRDNDGSIKRDKRDKRHNRFVQLRRRS